MTDTPDPSDRTSEDRAPDDRADEPPLDRPDGPVDRPDRRADADATAARERMRTAIRAVRREGQKAALIYATVDAVLALVVVTLVLRVVELPSLPSTLPTPAALVAVGAPSTVALAAVAGLAAGGTTFAVELAVRLRQPLVERFESVNPEVSEALRTARDAVESGRESRMATRLYATTIDRLRETSSLGLIDVRRIAVTFLLVALLAPASVHVAAVDYDLTFGGGGSEGPSDQASAADSEYEGLQNPDQVLGDPEDVRSGNRSVEATLPTQGTGDGNASSESYGSGGYAGDGVEVESQQAGFDEGERLEDAELIREYNLRIREDEQ